MALLSEISIQIGLRFSDEVINLCLEFITQVIFVILSKWKFMSLDLYSSRPVIWPVSTIFNNATIFNAWLAPLLQPITGSNLDYLQIFYENYRSGPIIYL